MSGIDYEGDNDGKIFAGLVVRGACDCIGCHLSSFSPLGQLQKSIYAPWIALIWIAKRAWPNARDICIQIK
jgi:hypothetical protein